MRVSAFKAITEKAVDYQKAGFSSYLTITEKIGEMELKNLGTTTDAQLKFVGDSNFTAIANEIATQQSKKLFIGWAHKPFDWRLLTFAHQWGYVTENETNYFNGNSFELRHTNTKNLYFNPQSIADEFFEVEKFTQDSLKHYQGKVLVVFKAVVEADSFECSPILVCDVALRKGKTDWHGSPIKDFPQVNGLTKANLTFAVDIHQIESMKCYIWNAQKCTYKLLDAEIEILPANPVMYGFFEEIITQH